MQPGWYPDPSRPDRSRWWDGSTWTEHTQPSPASGPGGAPAADAQPAAPGHTAAFSQGHAPHSGPFPTPAPFPPQPPRKRRRTGLIVGLAAAFLVVAIGATAVLVVLLSGPDVTWQGDSVVRPEETLVAAESAMRAEVTRRAGAMNDQSRCWFSRPVDREGDDVDFVRCGPVVFVDGDPGQPWLRYALRAEQRDDGTHLVPVVEPEESQTPQRLGDGEELVRFDDADVPSGSAGLTAPPPPPAEPDLVEFVGADAVEPADTPEPRNLRGWDSGVLVSPYGEVERFGRGDDARRPADGHVFVAAQVRATSGDGSGYTRDTNVTESGPAVISVKIGTRDVPLTELTGADQIVVLSVPQDEKAVDLVITDRDLTQSISLLTGTPAPTNPAVLARESPMQELGPGGGPVRVRQSKPGFITEEHTCTLTVYSARLTWFGGPDARTVPADPAKAYLRLVATCDWDSGEPQSGLEAELQQLVLPDGTTIAAVDLNPDPERLWPAFEVPADLTTATVKVAGSYVAPNGVTVEIVSGLDVAIQIPA